MVLFDKPTYDKLLSEVPKFKLITPSILSDCLRVRKSLITYSLRLLSCIDIKLFVHERAGNSIYALYDSLEEDIHELDALTISSILPAFSDIGFNVYLYIYMCLTLSFHISGFGACLPAAGDVNCGYKGSFPRFIVFFLIIIYGQLYNLTS